MKHISEIIEDILVEWAYRVHDGMPNPKNTEHIQQLRESMEELNLPNNVIYQVIENLINEQQQEIPFDPKVKSKPKGEKTPLNDKSKKEVERLKLIWKGKGYGKEGETGITHKNDGKGNLIPIDKTDDTPAPETDTEPKRTKISKDGKLTKKGDDEEKDIKAKDDKGTEPQTPTDVQRNKKFGKTYSEPLTTTDKQFNEKNRNNKTKTTSTYVIPDSIKNNPKIPKKYTQLLERMLNTKRNTDVGTETSDYYGLEGVGAGNLEANIGELMTMMSTTLRGKEAQEFFAGIEEHLGEVDAAGEETHVGPKWVKAAKQNRSAILRLFRDRFGNDYELEAGSWDIEDEVQSMGMDYGDKGFSTDIFFKLKTPEGDSVFAEISLKQGLTANLHNGGVGSTFEGKHELPLHLQPNTYSDNQVANNDNYYQVNQNNIIEFIKNLDTTDSDYENKLKEIAKEMSPNSKNNQTKIISGFKQMIQNAQEDLLSDENLTIDRNYVGSIRQAGEKKQKFTGAKKETLKPLLVLARLQAKFGDDTADEFVKGQEELSKDYARQLLTHVGTSQEAKDAVLKSVQEKLPLKTVADGQEDIILADTALTDKTLQVVFGTSDWNEISENLIVDADSEPPVIQYVGKVKGRDVTVPISTINVREAGRGYVGSHKFDMVLDKNFAKRIKQASNEVYGDQEPIPADVGVTTPSPTGGRDVAT